MPGDAGPVVVGAAILHSEAGSGVRVLAAQRRTPAHLAGMWEFPGGKVEEGESEPDALRRECREELGVDVEVLRRVGPDVSTVPGRRGAPVLKVWLCRVAHGLPVAREHADLRWLTPGELGSVPWIAADAPVVRALAGVLS